jgi:hypothetical protein
LVVVAVLFVAAACEENKDPQPGSTTTTTFVDSNDRYVRKPLPRNGWTVEQGDLLYQRLERAYGSRVVTQQPDVTYCALDWFVDLYTTSEIFELDDELFRELGTEAADNCVQWTLEQGEL